MAYFPYEIFVIPKSLKPASHWLSKLYWVYKPYYWVYKPTIGLMTIPHYMGNYGGLEFFQLKQPGRTFERFGAHESLLPHGIFSVPQVSFRLFTPSGQEYVPKIKSNCHNCQIKWEHHLSQGQNSLYWGWETSHL